VSFSGLVHIFDINGFLLTVGTAEIADDLDLGTWTGTLSVIDGTGVAGKALVVDLDMDGVKGRAQLIPKSVTGDMATSRIIGLAPITG
jgi:hypothetical protein